MAAESPRTFRFETRRNLALISWREAPWDEVTKLASLIEAFRSANPDGSAIFNLVVANNHPGMRAAWTRMGAVFLTARGKDWPPARDLGTAHLFDAKGFRGATTRSLLEFVTSRGKDFTAHGNKITRTVQEAADWLHARLADGPIVWRGVEMRELLECYCNDDRKPSVPLSGAHP
jgi:hypothetical protein